MSVCSDRWRLYSLSSIKPTCEYNIGEDERGELIIMLRNAWRSKIKVNTSKYRMVVLPTERAFEKGLCTWSSKVKCEVSPDKECCGSWFWVLHACCGPALLLNLFGVDPIYEGQVEAGKDEYKVNVVKTSLVPLQAAWLQASPEWSLETHLLGLWGSCGWMQIQP